MGEEIGLAPASWPVFRRWIVTGREDLAPDAGDEACEQLALRHRLTAPAARSDGLRHQTPRLGRWLDTSNLTVEQTVEAILS